MLIVLIDSPLTRVSCLVLSEGCTWSSRAYLLDDPTAAVPSILGATVAGSGISESLARLIVAPAVNFFVSVLYIYSLIESL